MENMGDKKLLRRFADEIVSENMRYFFAQMDYNNKNDAHLRCNKCLGPPHEHDCIVGIAVKWLADNPGVE